MPKRRSTIAATAVAMSMYMATTTQAALIDMTLSDSTIYSGDTFQVWFVMDGLTSDPGDSLSGFDLDVLFDTSYMSYIDADFTNPTQGNPLAFSEPDAFAFYSQATEVESGRVDALAYSGNTAEVLDSNQSDRFQFLTLTFQAIEATDATRIGLDTQDPYLQWYDSDFGDLGVSFGNIDLNFSISDTVTQVPEPASLALLGIGLLGLLVSRRKRHLFTDQGGSLNVR